MAPTVALCSALALPAAHGGVDAAATLPPSAATADNAMARRARACTGCHGEQGRAAADGYQPRIAGKPAGYLFEQLLAFRDGRRRYGLMAQLFEPLSDGYLRALAEHFAALDLPYPAPQPNDLDAAQRARAERLVREGDAALRVPACQSCHGPRLTGVQPAVPSLLGLPRDYLAAQLGAWRNGTRAARAPDCMAELTRRLTPADLALVAAWLAAQPVPVPARAAAPSAHERPPSNEPALRCGSGGAERP